MTNCTNLFARNGLPGMGISDCIATPVKGKGEGELGAVGSLDPHMDALDVVWTASEAAMIVSTPVTTSVALGLQRMEKT